MMDTTIIKNTEVLSHEKYILKKVTIERVGVGGQPEEQTKEVYDIGNAATVLLYNLKNRKVLLCKQFRLPVFLNQHPTGMLMEACAGKISKESPEACIRREIEEETGYRVPVVKKVFEAYTSPGTLTEMLYFFTAEYDSSMKVSDGGGLKEEKEDIEVVELTFEEVVQRCEACEIRDAKTLLLIQYARLKGIL